MINQRVSFRKSNAQIRGHQILITKTLVAILFNPNGCESWLSKMGVESWDLECCSSGKQENTGYIVPSKVKWKLLN